MDPKALRKRQIAKRLGVSEQVLEQYLQLKNAEVLQPVGAEEPAGEARDRSAATARQRRSTPRVADGRRSLRPERG